MALLALVVVVAGVIRLGTHKSSPSTPATGPGTTLAPIETSTPPPPVQASTPATPPSPTPSATATHHHKAKATSSPSASSSASHKSTASATPSSHATHTATPSASSSAALVTPTLGSYSYATSGSEKLAGQTRNYPTKSKITLAKDGYCVSSTWQPISQHKEVQVVCPAGTQAVQLRSEAQTIGVGGFNVTQTLSCDSSAIVYATALKAGSTWSFTCTGSGATAKQQAKAIGFKTLTIGGKSVKALHVHIDTTISGGDTGTATEDYWYAPSLGMLVKEKMVTNAKQGTFTYAGHYTLTLTSTKPS